MFFGVSYGEIIVTVIVGSLVLGPKDLPIVSRLAGRLTGQAVAYLSQVRSNFLNFADKTEVAQLHREVEDSLKQLKMIRHELRHGLSFTNMSHPRAQAAASAVTRAAAEPETWSRPREESLAAAPGLQDPLMARRAITVSASRFAGSAECMPVSAVAAGLAQNRAGKLATGADVALDALLEEQVAREARRFMRTHMPPTPGMGKGV